MEVHGVCFSLGERGLRLCFFRKTEPEKSLHEKSRRGLCTLGDPQRFPNFLRPLRGSERRIRHSLRLSTRLPSTAWHAAMPQQSEATLLTELTEVPAGWSLGTVIDAFCDLARYRPGQTNPDRALQALSRRLVDLWASQPAEAQAWRELHAKDATRPEELQEALLRHGAAECGKHWYCGWRFSEAGLLGGELWRSAAERKEAAAAYLQKPHARDRCRELAEKLAQAESRETARKRQKLEEKRGSERRRLEAELHTSQEEGREAAAIAWLRWRRRCAERPRSSKQRRTRAPSARSGAKSSQLAPQPRSQPWWSCSRSSARASSVVRSSRLGWRQKQLSMPAPRSVSHRPKPMLRKGGWRWSGCKRSVAATRSAASTRRRHLGLVLAESKELELKNARLQERCEQLQQQLAKAEGQIQVLWEEKATYKERCRQLEREVTSSPRTPSIQASHTQQGPTPSDDAASRGQESNLTEELGYVLVEDGVASSSALSCSSWFSVQPDCFMPDTIFKTRSGGIEHFLRGRDLQKGSRVVAGDGETMVEVCEAPVLSQAKGFVRLQAGAAMLEVTADHPVQVPAADDGMADGEGGASKRYVPAGSLKPGALVMLDAGEPAAVTSVESKSGDCEVLKLAFKPNLSVAVFSCPPCILSKGANSKPDPRRGKKCRSRGQQAKVEESADDGRASVPNTAGTSTEILLRGAAGAS